MSSRDYRLVMHDNRLFALLDEAEEDALRAALKWLLAKTLPRVPLDVRPGRDEVVLRKTGRVLIDPERNTGAVVFGDDSTDAYAVRQHEDMNLHHPVPGTQAKFLERTFEEGRETMQLIMATVIRRRLLGR
jgi:hypothetical protein